MGWITVIKKLTDIPSCINLAKDVKNSPVFDKYCAIHVIGLNVPASHAYSQLLRPLVFYPH